MTEIELKQLAATWIRLCQAKSNSEEYEEDFWSFETLSDLCHDNPENGWRAIVEIYANQPDEMVLSNLAAGPLEDLFVYHGHLALAWADQYCGNEAGFVKVLKMVWRNAMPDEVWVDLSRVIERYT